jgi:hypothetical protein
MVTANQSRPSSACSGAVFEPTISAGKRPQTYTLDLAATGTVKWAVGFLNMSTSVLPQFTTFTDIAKGEFWSDGTHGGVSSIII